MTAAAAEANVVYLESHPVWRSTRRRSEDLLAAMRRHPSYQGDRPAEREDHTAPVLQLRAR